MKSYHNHDRNKISPRLADLGRLLSELINNRKIRVPSAPIPVVRESPTTLESSEDSLYWLGHSSVLLTFGGRHFLLDPVLSSTFLSFPFNLAPRRFSRTLPMEPGKIPQLEALVLSHDHYDHMNRETIMTLDDRVKTYLVPLGVESHLLRWGIHKEKIQTLDWWEETHVGGVHITCTPARHFSGRSFFGRNKTLWCSWTFKGKKSSLFFSGDSGYGDHFGEIGEKLGPFDVALVECGQYNPAWRAIHMMPEESLRAGMDVGGRSIIPIHWGMFSLALHSWNDPAIRISQAANGIKSKLIIPRVGERVKIGISGSMEYGDPWWKELG